MSEGAAYGSFAQRRINRLRDCAVDVGQPLFQVTAPAGGSRQLSAASCARLARRSVQSVRARSKIRAAVTERAGKRCEYCGKLGL